MKIPLITPGEMDPFIIGYAAKTGQKPFTATIDLIRKGLAWSSFLDQGCPHPERRVKVFGEDTQYSPRREEAYCGRCGAKL